MTLDEIKARTYLLESDKQQLIAWVEALLPMLQWSATGIKPETGVISISALYALIREITGKEP